PRRPDALDFTFSAAATARFSDPRRRTRSPQAGRRDHPHARLRDLRPPLSRDRRAGIAHTSPKRKRGPTRNHDPKLLPHGLPRHVEQEYLIDRLEVRVIFELPHYFFVARHLDHVGLHADVSMPQIV